jgi:hypothetical protein
MGIPKNVSEKREKKTFKDYEIGYVHVDITHLVLEGNMKNYLFVGILISHEDA